MFNNQLGPLYSQSFNNNPFPIPYRHVNHINWKNLLNNTQKTLNVINQAAPLVYQMKPLYNNVKTLLKVNRFLKNDDNSNSSCNNEYQKKNIDSNKPIFYL